MKIFLNLIIVFVTLFSWGQEKYSLPEYLTDKKMLYRFVGNDWHDKFTYDYFKVVIDAIEKDSSEIAIVIDYSHNLFNYKVKNCDCNFEKEDPFNFPISVYVNQFYEYLCNAVIKNNKIKVFGLMQNRLDGYSLYYYSSLYPEIVSRELIDKLYFIKIKRLSEDVEDEKNEIISQIHQLDSIDNEWDKFNIKLQFYTILFNQSEFNGLIQNELLKRDKIFYLTPVYTGLKRLEYDVINHISKEFKEEVFYLNSDSVYKTVSKRRFKQVANKFYTNNKDAFLVGKLSLFDSEKKKYRLRDIENINNSYLINFNNGNIELVIGNEQHR